MVPVFPLANKDQKGLRAAQEMMGENAFSADGTSLCVTRVHKAEAGMLLRVKAGEAQPMGDIDI